MPLCPYIHCTCDSTGVYRRQQPLTIKYSVYLSGTYHNIKILLAHEARSLPNTPSLYLICFQLGCPIMPIAHPYWKIFKYHKPLLWYDAKNLLTYRNCLPIYIRTNLFVACRLEQIGYTRERFEHSQNYPTAENTFCYIWQPIIWYDEDTEINVCLLLCVCGIGQGFYFVYKFRKTNLLLNITLTPA